MKIRRMAGMFLSYTADSIKGYVAGLFPRTEICFLTNKECRKVINISRVWMGKVMDKNDVYELKEIDKERIRLEKENLPRIEEIIRKYEEENGKITVDRTGMSRT